MAGIALICAGGTGGHLFPAEALSRSLMGRGWRVHLATDHRVDAYAGDFPAEAVHIIPSATLTRSPVSVVRGLARLAKGYLAGRRMIAAVTPDVAVGFGGYPTVPPMLAASRAKVPTVIHDANAVLGRANRFLARRVDAIATAVENVAGAGDFVHRVTETGNPVRPAVLEAATTPYPPLGPDDPVRLLVFGGSQGARFLSDLVPDAVGRLTPGQRARLSIVQQCRAEDLDRVGAAYGTLGVEADLKAFFTDMAARIAACHLVISRSGASTVAELAVIGRPAIMVPLPHALDQDQKANALVLARAGGGWMVEQRDMNPERLAADLGDLMGRPEQLRGAAAAAKHVGRPDAVERLADLVERIAKEKKVEGRASP